MRQYEFQEKSDFLKAEQKLTQLLKQPEYRSNPIPYFLRGELYQALGDFQRAQLDYGKVIQLSQRDWFAAKQSSLLIQETKGRLAIIYYKSNYTELAKRFLPSSNASAPLQEASLLAALSDRLEYPERADFRFILAQELVQHLELAKAQEELRSAQQLVRNPQLLMEIENYQKTQMPHQIKTLSPLLQYYALAAVYYQDEHEDIPRAIVFLKKAIALAPTFEWLHSELALAYRKNHQYEAAKRHAKVAAGINPNLYHAYLTLGDLAVDEAQYQLAILNFKKANTIMNHLPDGRNQRLQSNVHNQIGYAFECMQQWELAQTSYRQAMTDADSRDDVDAFNEYEYAQEALERVATGMKQHHPILSQGKQAPTF